MLLHIFQRWSMAASSRRSLRGLERSIFCLVQTVLLNCWMKGFLCRVGSPGFWAIQRHPGSNVRSYATCTLDQIIIVIPRVWGGSATDCNLIYQSFCINPCPVEHRGTHQRASAWTRNTWIKCYRNPPCIWPIFSHPQILGHNIIKVHIY